MDCNLLVRQMAEEDLPEVIRLYKDLYTEQKEAGMVMDLNHAELSDMLLVQLKSKFYISLVLSDGNNIKGFAVGSIIRLSKKYKLPGQDFIGFVNDIYLERDIRKSGCGKTLLDELENRFKANGIKYSELHVIEGNENGKGFWRKVGYNNVIRIMYKHL